MSDRSEEFADQPQDGRQLTSHERRSGLPWDASYQGGPAPWDLGRPQPAIVRPAAGVESWLSSPWPTRSGWNV